MKFKTGVLSASALLSSLVLCQAEDVKITLDQAPAAVQKAIKEQAGANKIVRIEKAKEEGQIQYEALTEQAGGKKIEYIIKADGTLDSTEEKLSIEQLPAEVAAPLKQAVGDGKIKAVERVTKGGTITYEAGYKTAKGVKQEAVVSSEGKLIKNGPETD